MANLTLFNNCKIIQQNDNRENLLESLAEAEGAEWNCCDSVDDGGGGADAMSGKQVWGGAGGAGALVVSEWRTGSQSLPALHGGSNHPALQGEIGACDGVRLL